MAEPRTAHRSRLGAGLGSATRAAAATVVFLVAWEVLARSAESFFFPPMSTILLHTWGDFLGGPASQLFVSDAFVEHVVPSLGRFAAGWALGILVGVAAGLAIGWWPWFAAAADPLVRFGMAVPPPALLPFAIVLLGLGDTMKVFLIAFGTLWPILLNTIDGVRSVDPLMLQTSRMLQLPRRRFLTSVLLPGASPQIFAGLRVSLATALILMVISELYASVSGIGYYIVRAQRSFLIVEMWAGIVVLAVLGLLLNAAFLRIERRALRWHTAAR